MKKFVFLILILLSVTAGLYSEKTAAGKKSEAINGFRIDQDAIVFLVFNTGYTDKSSFKITVSGKKEMPELELVRVRADDGKMMPDVIEIRFTQDELKGRLNIKNTMKVKNTFCFTKI